ncbi:MAG: tyrosine-type recombinase/integrase [Akkermansia sp.]|nr:tyrosine-type recombinase/integrase [Akkermansia sp.]
MATFRGADGKMKRRSTKVPVEGGMFMGERLTRAQAKKRALIVGAQIAQEAAQEYVAHDNTPVRAFLDGYIARAGRRLRLQSVANIRSARDRFCEWLGRRADEPLRLISRKDAKEYMEFRREQIRCSSVTRELGCLKTAFEDAVDSEMIDRNPWRNLRVPQDVGAEKHRREAFTLEELRYIIDKFPPEWSSAVRCSYETFGQRLGDVLGLRWGQFDWERRVVRFTTGKTGRELEQPMRDGFYAWARARYEAAGCDDGALLHPRLAGCSSSVSYEFTQLLRAHGIGVQQGRLEGKRQSLHSKSFHSIRATAATFLQSAGVAQGMAMKLVGHDSESIHEVYVKPDVELLRQAAEVLPEV